MNSRARVHRNLFAGVVIAGLAAFLPCVRGWSASSLVLDNAATPHTGWLYVVDTRNGDVHSRVLLIDPSDGKVMRSYEAGMYPDIALTPDGSRIYVSSNRANANTQLLEGFLEVYDTTSGALVSRIVNPDTMQATMPVYPTRMAMAPSGKYIYMLKNHNTPETTDFYIAAFDTIDNRFLHDHVSIPECHSVLLPTTQDLTLYVGCMDSGTVREITLSDSTQPLKHALLNVKGFNLVNRWGAMFLGPDEKHIGFIARDGSGFMLDLSSETTHDLGNTFTGGKLNGLQVALVSRSQDAVYFAAGEPRGKIFDFYDQVVKADLTTLATTTTLTTSVPFFSMALSGDGNTLYTVNPHRATITVVDASSTRELQRLSPIGQTPIFVVPVP
ncbi:MAG: amine dehydrogenase large subunit [Candidatus Acidiferrales bacterium]